MTQIQITATDENINPEAQHIECYAIITELSNWQDILNDYASIKQQLQPKKVLLILDDIPQAEYTSMHAIEDEALYFDSEAHFEDVGDDDEAWEIAYKNSQPLAVAHYVLQLHAQANQKQLKQLAEKTKYYDAEDIQAILRINEHPLPVLDTQINVKVATLTDDAEKIAIFPNGYFSADFNSFENFALIRHLATYGFEFIGIGASLLYWIKTERFDHSKVETILQDLAQVYPLAVADQDKLKTLILENNYLILPYCESPQAYLDAYSH